MRVYNSTQTKLFTYIHLTTLHTKGKISLYIVSELVMEQMGIFHQNMKIFILESPKTIFQEFEF